jgi:predicted negative regulator of RcsB-dependent stress response
MFDGSLWIELLRARCMYDIATSVQQTKRESKWRNYLLRKVGDVLIGLGQRLKANTQHRHAYELGEDTQRQ